MEKYDCFKVVYKTDFLGNITNCSEFFYDIEDCKNFIKAEDIKDFRIIGIIDYPVHDDITNLI